MKKILLSCFIVTYTFVFSQTQLVFVYFKDKPNKADFFANPTSELSQKSLDRRINLSIPLDDSDAPIEPTYIQNIKDLGFTVTDYSKWLNGVSVNATIEQITLLQSQSYVQSVESFIVHPYSIKISENNSAKFTNRFLTDYNYGNSTAQIDQINLRQLHVAGFTGTDVSIAVIDTGFPTVDTGSTFARIRDNNQIKGGYNFISKNSDIYNTSLHNHGTIVLGTIAGYIENIFVGSAPDANFYLYCSETTSVEIPEEQLYWIEAAEEADRKGVDIITTSLGYNVFNDSRYDLTYADMNGKISFIARGAEIAVNKGIFVLAAAGNSGQKSWHYILTPADNEKVFTVGAVDSAGNPSTFTSFGPNSDGHIKPDASARGTSAASVYDDSETSSNGTSFAAPIAAGGVACLLQFIPKNTNRDLIRERLRQTASLAPNNTDQLGFGILNFGDTFNSFLANQETAKLNLKIYPNPVKNLIHIISSEKVIIAELYNSLGQLISSTNSKNINVETLNKGIYFLKIKTEKSIKIEKIIKE